MPRDNAVPTQEPFRPKKTRVDKPLPHSFRAQVSVTDAARAAVFNQAMRKSGLTAPQFVIACMEYAIKHMEAD
jgi:hypothetical protein